MSLWLDCRLSIVDSGVKVELLFVVLHSASDTKKTSVRRLMVRWEYLYCSMTDHRGYQRKEEEQKKNVLAFGGPHPVLMS